MSSNQRWRLYVKNLESKIRLGIYSHERELPQRIMINATVEAEYAGRPQAIDECFNYDTIYALVTEEWPKRPHVELLETLVVELLEFIFRDPRVAFAKVRIDKPDIFTEAESVGVEAEWKRG